MTVSGTNVNEILESLSNGDIIRLIGTGWRPRSHSMEIVSKGQTVILQYDIKHLKHMRDLIDEFIKTEAEMKVKHNG